MKAPCEITSSYVLPSLRRELVKSMIKEGHKRREVAKILGISEAAIAYYLKAKRGSKYKFSKEQLIEIEKIAKRIVKKKGSATLEACKFCSMFKKSLK